MLLSILVILFIGLVAYIHYVQGLLTGIISAVLAVVAAMMAVSYAEPLSNTMNGGKYADTSFGICIVVIFAAVYLIGRTIFDSLIPGNVRLPHLVDAIGGAICGVIAGIFATGIVMIAFQSMPFGPSIGGYARYEIKDKRDVKAMQGENSNRQVDRIVYDELVNDDLTKGQSGMLLPVDDIVLGMAKRLSSSGSLAGDRPLESVHPDLLQEFFGQRIGLETAAKHTAFAKGSPAAEVKAVTVMGPLPKVPSESPLIRPAPAKGEKLTAGPQKVLVAVTVSFKPEAADEDHMIRVATGNVRLVTKYTDENGETHWKNNFPLGTVQPIGGVWSAWINKPDDFLFLKENGVHFLFELDNSAFTDAPGAKPAAGAAAPAEGAKPAAAPEAQFQPGAFIELKRLTRIPLDNVRVKVGTPPEGAQYYPLRKFEIYKEKPAPKGPTGAPPPPVAQQPSQPGGPTEENGWKNAPLADPVVVGGNKIPYPIGVGTNDADADVAGAGFDGHLTGKKFDTLNTDTASAESTPAALAKAAPTVQELFEPQGMRMVQVKFKIVSSDPWAWRTHAQNLQVFSPTNQSTFTPYGGYGMLKPTSGGPDRVFFVYRAASQLGGFPIPQGKLDEVTLIYLIPAGQKVTEARFSGRPNGLPLNDQ